MIVLDWTILSAPSNLSPPHLEIKAPVPEFGRVGLYSTVLTILDL